MKSIKIKYRIEEISFMSAKKIYVAQYKIFGIWLSINNNYSGAWLYSNCYCETLDEAYNRILIHKRNMLRASDWPTRVIKRYDC